MKFEANKGYGINDRFIGMTTYEDYLRENKHKTQIEIASELGCEAINVLYEVFKKANELKP